MYPADKHKANKIENTNTAEKIANMIVDKIWVWIKSATTIPK